MVAAHQLLDLAADCLGLLVLETWIPRGHVESLVLLLDLALFLPVVQSPKTEEIDIGTHILFWFLMDLGAVVLIQLETFQIVFSLHDLYCQFPEDNTVETDIDLPLVLVLWLQELEVVGILVFLAEKGCFWLLFLELALDL